MLTDQIYSDFLKDLITEHEESFNMFSDIAAKRHPPEAEFAEIRKDLDNAIGWASYSKQNSTSFSEAAFNWWSKIESETFGQRDRFVRLHFLLCRIDDYYSEKRIVKMTASNGHIVLGRRFWDLYASNTGKKAGSVIPRTTFDIFPHLRATEIKKNEWFEGQNIARAFRHVERSNELRIGLCVFSGRAKTMFVGTKEREQGVFGFRAGTIEEADSYLKELQECIMWAADEGIHILLMPELSVCPEGLNKLKKVISDTKNELCAIFPGSFHVQSDIHKEQWVNAAPIWLVHREGGKTTVKDNLIPRYEKADIFSMNLSKASGMPNAKDAYEKAKKAKCDHLAEDIAPRRSFRLMSTPVGVMGILVCKDALAPGPFIDEYKKLADHLMVLSMNAKAGFFDPFGRKSARLSGLATFYVNASQLTTFQKAHVETAFWFLPCRIEDGDNRVCYYHQTETSSSDPLPIADSEERWIQDEDNGFILVDPIPIPPELFS